MNETRVGFSKILSEKEGAELPLNLLNELESGIRAQIRRRRFWTTLSMTACDSAIEVRIDERRFDPTHNLFGGPLHRTGAVYGAPRARQHRTAAPHGGRAIPQYPHS